MHAGAWHIDLVSGKRVVKTEVNESRGSPQSSTQFGFEFPPRLRFPRQEFDLPPLGTFFYICGKYVVTWIGLLKGYGFLLVYWSLFQEPGNNRVEFA